MIIKFLNNSSKYFKSSFLRKYSVYDPPESWYESLGIYKDDKPVFNQPINVQIKSYDFAVLENFQSSLHRISKSLNIKIKDAHGTPANTTKITTFKKRSKIPENSYMLNMYQRNIIFENLSALQFPIVYEIFNTILPEGVKISFKYYQESDINYLYITDSELKTLKDGLEIMNKEEQDKISESIQKKRVKEEAKILKGLSNIMG
ncbi:unnamed protein product [Gordionus sp. m RMFG-2023]